MPTSQEIAATAGTPLWDANAYIAALVFEENQRKAQSQLAQISPQEDARLEQQKHDQAFHMGAPRDDRNLPQSAEFNAINQQYAASRNQVVTSGGSVYQGPVSNPNPYDPNTAAGIAYEVAKTGGGTDKRMNAIAERQVIAQGGDPSFIRYATDIYVERPSFRQETLTTKTGQTFVNEAWTGVPVRLNLTRDEMAGFTPSPSKTYLNYNQDTFMLDRFNPTAAIGIDPGVHTKFGDFGGPILKGNSYGGWQRNDMGIVSTALTVPMDYVPFGAPSLKGGTKVAEVGTRIDATSPQNVEVLMAGGALPKPFRSGESQTVIEAPRKESWMDPFQNSIRNTVSLMPGGIGVAMASDTVFAIAKGNPQDLPFYDLSKSIYTPYTKKEGSVTTEQYNAALSGYNSRVSAYETDQSAYTQSSGAYLTGYSSKLAAYNSDKSAFEKGGSKDLALYTSLKTKYTELQTMQSGFGTQTQNYDKLQGTYGQLQTDRLALEAQSKNIENPPSVFDSIGKIYESANKGLAPYTTDTTGLGRKLEATPDIDLKKYGDTSGVTWYSDAINLTKGAYVGASQHPLDIALTYAGGSALGLGERVVAGGVARAAMGELPVVSRLPGVATAGRALSTPLASDVVTVGKLAFGGFVAYEAGANIIAQPTATGRGEAIGRTAIQFGGFGAGMIKGDISALPGETPNRVSTLLTGYNSYVASTPTNSYAGRTMQGVLMDSPLETSRSYVSMQLNRLTMPAEESAIYRNNWDVARAVKYIEPYKLTEPQVGQLARVPPEHVLPIENTVRDVPFVGQGSGFVQAQRSPLPTGDRLGPSKDLDAFSKGFMDRLAQEPGATRMSVATPHGGGVKDTIFINQKPVAADIHEFPAGYPNVGQNAGVASRPTIGLPESKSPDVHDVGWGTRLLGQPLKPQPTSLTQIRNPETEGTHGDIFRYEKENIQALRVLEAANRDLQTLSGENTRGYRLEKDIYRSKTVPEELIAVERARGTPQAKAMEPLFKKADAALADNMQRSITFERNAGSAPETRTIGEIYNQGLVNVQAGRVPYKMEFATTETQNVFTLKSETANKYGFAEGTKFKGEIISTPEPLQAPTINTVGKYSGPEYEAKILARQKMYDALPEGSRTSYQSGKKTIVVPENNPSVSISTVDPDYGGLLAKSPKLSNAYSFSPSVVASAVSSLLPTRSALPSYGSSSPPPSLLGSSSMTSGSSIKSASLLDSGRVSSMYSSEIVSPSPLSFSNINPLYSSPSPSPSIASVILPSLLPSPSRYISPGLSYPPSPSLSPSPASPPSPSYPPYEYPPYRILPPIDIVTPPGAPFLPSGGSSSPFGRKRRYNFMEVFNFGLDMSGPIATAPRGMKSPRVKRSGLPGGKQKVKISRKKRK
jgi:hypothetical protein